MKQSASAQSEAEFSCVGSQCERVCSQNKGEVWFSANTRDSILLRCKMWPCMVGLSLERTSSLHFHLATVIWFYITAKLFLAFPAI